MQQFLQSLNPNTLSDKNLLYKNSNPQITYYRSYPSSQFSQQIHYHTDSDNGNSKIYKKYNQFMEIQNNIITTTLMQNNRINNTVNKVEIDKYGQDNNIKQKQNKKIKNNNNIQNNSNSHNKYVHVQEQIVNKIRDSSNQFIKQLLKQLAQVYTKMRIIKSNSQQKIQQLQSQIIHQRQTTKQIARQYHFQSQNKQTQTQHFHKTHKKQLQNAVQMYQQKIKNLQSTLENKQTQYNVLYAQKLQLNNQLAQLNRVLRLQRQNCNQKTKEFKGMEMLVKQYQSAVQEYERDSCLKNQIIGDLKHKLEKVQGFNKQLVEELDISDKQMREMKMQIQNLNKIIQSQKCNNVEYLKQIQYLKQNQVQQQKLYENNLKISKNNQTNLQLQLEASLLKSSKTNQQITDLNKKLDDANIQITNMKQQTKKTLQKLQNMFKSSKSLNLCQKLLNFQKASILLEQKL